MNLKEIDSQMREFEEEENLFDKNADGVHHWERIRPFLIREIRQEKTSQENKSNSKESLYNQIKKLWLAFKNIFHKNPSLSQKRDLLFITRGRREKNNSQWIEKNIDPLIDLLPDKQCLVAEEAFKEFNA